MTELTSLFEAHVEAWLADRLGRSYDVRRQVRTPAGRIIDLIAIGDGACFVIEVKRGRAGMAALEQLARYLLDVHDLRESLGSDVPIAGVIAAPRFSPELQAWADRNPGPPVLPVVALLTWPRAAA